MTTPPRRRMPWSFRLWFAFLGLMAAGMIAAAVWSALVVMDAGPAGYRGMNAPPPAAPASAPAPSTATGRP
ncbi:hypothetical protein [Azospirillum sp. TSO22-1]|uniref:hypothetical protein n=1 Tax=Azospirillum sp. TSO22-1 TaxID=716789 RepID=UPI0011B721E7|nr:hypothetical protein [Azospirillum sp. TSO22-1]